MPAYSPLLGKVPAYPFAEVGRRSKAAAERDGIDVINARIGIPDVEASPTVKRRMAEYVLEDKSTFGYPVDVHPARGIDELVDAVRQNYRDNHGVDLQPENITITGWTKIPLHTLAKLYAHGNGVLPVPVYPAYEAAIILAGDTVRRISASGDTEWLPEFALQDGDSYLYFCDPNNPTGAVADIGCYERLLDEMQRHDVGGIFDGAYKYYTFDDETRPVSITQVPGLMDQGYEAISLSKHHNFVGIGLGWMVSSPENIDRWLNFEGQYGQGVPLFMQKAGVVALTDPNAKAEIAAYMEQLKERRDLLAGGLNDLGLECELPKATPYIWARVPEGRDDKEFVLDTLLDRGHVALMPGSYFGESGSGYLRATIFLSKGEIEEALSRIDKIRDW